MESISTNIYFYGCAMMFKNLLVYLEHYAVNLYHHLYLQACNDVLESTSRIGTLLGRSLLTSIFTGEQ